MLGTPATAPSYLLLHGHEHHKPHGHWLVWLAAELQRLGAQVRYPQLPQADDPDPAGWVEVIADELGSAEPAPTVICHSLATVAWLRAATTIELPITRVLLVAPPSPLVLATIPEIADFAITEFSAGMIAAVAAVPTLIVAGDDDPYCPEGAQHWYGAPLGVDVALVPGGGHLDVAAGYGAWPSMLRWCLDRVAFRSRRWLSGSDDGVPADRAEPT